MIDPASIQRVVLIRPSALGDVCRTVPVLASLRQALPAAAIDWVVQDDFAPAIEAHPALTNVIRFPRSRLAGWWHHPGRFAHAINYLNELRRRKYDLAIDCQGLSRSGIMTGATRARYRVGLRSAREFAWLAYNTRVRPVQTHTVDQMLALVQAIGIQPVHDMRLYERDEDRRWWKSRRAELGLRADYAVIAPTSRWPSKNWPLERFAQIVEPLMERGFSHVAFIGSPSDVPKVQELLDDPSLRRAREAGSVINLAGGTTIGQTLSVIAGAELVIANDSAPLHMAVGFDRPIVALFGPTDPAVVGPYGRQALVIRGYAAAPGEIVNFKDRGLGDRLMRFISTTAVLQKVDQALTQRDVRMAECMKPQGLGGSFA